MTHRAECHAVRPAAARGAPVVRRSDLPDAAGWRTRPGWEAATPVRPAARGAPVVRRSDLPDAAGWRTRPGWEAATPVRPAARGAPVVRRSDLPDAAGWRTRPGWEAAAPVRPAARSVGLGCCALGEQRELALEVRQVVEALVHRGEAHGGDGVELA
jgi:hypothetical protein